MTRRQFLKMAGATGLAALPLSALASYELLRAVEGEAPPNLSPYATLPGQWREPASPIWLILPDVAEGSFGAYLAEILCAEGLNCFRVRQWSDLSPTALAGVPLVVLAEGAVTASHSDRLRDYVAAGGRLIAMRPEAQLADLFSVEAVTGGTSEAYLQVNPQHAFTPDIAAEALQFHGPARHYRPMAASVIAWLADKTARTQYPAVTWARFGQGQAVLWAFDLARSVALTRQGNPAWANQARISRDGNIRAQDMFPGWLDLDRIALPQADEQMRLFSHLITELLNDVAPLPRLWYFPAAVNTLLIATGDSHQNNWGAIEGVLRRVEQRQGHMTVYYAPPLAAAWRRAVRRARDWADDLPVIGDRLDQPSNFPTTEHIAQWLLRGHEFGLHPYVEAGLAEGWERYWREFTGLGFGPVSQTVRTHRILWTGWAESARAQAVYGMRLNLDYYHYGPTFQKPEGEWVFGNFTGSGLPMKFVDESGRVVNLYQQVTQLVDEHLLDMPWGERWAPLTTEEAVMVSRQQIDRSLAGGYSAIATQFHIDPYVFDTPVAQAAGQWLDGTLDYAAERNVPIWSAQDWLEFTELRHDARLDALRWDDDARQLSFRLSAAEDPEIRLGVLLPQRHANWRLTRVEVDGQTAAHVLKVLAGRPYVEVSLTAGKHSVTAAYA